MIVSNANGDSVIVETNGEPVLVQLDWKSIAYLMAGGEVDLPAVGVRLKAGGDLGCLVWDVRRKMHGGRMTQKPLPLKDQ